MSFISRTCFLLPSKYDSIKVPARLVYGKRLACLHINTSLASFALGMLSNSLYRVAFFATVGNIDYTLSLLRTCLSIGISISTTLQVSINTNSLFGCDFLFQRNPSSSLVEINKARGEFDSNFLSH